MNQQNCESCGKPGSPTTCSFCRQSGVSCADCFKLHCDSDTFMTTVDSQGREIQVPIPFCNFDTKRASWFTADLLNVCDDHCEGKEVFPLEQAPVLAMYPDQGIEILRRAKKIDQVVALLQGVPDELERKLVESVERDCESLIVAVDAIKEKFKSEVRKQVNELRVNLNNVLQLLDAQKLQWEVTATTTLEEMVFSLPLEELLESLNAEQWFVYSCDRETIRNIQKNFVCLRRSESLLDQPLAACPWKDDYYCLPATPFHIFNIPEQKVCGCQSQVDYTDSIVWTVLPDGSVFFCGDETSTVCRLLDADYSDYHKIGDLVSVRACPGIVYYEGAVYIFGGKHAELPMKSIETFSLRTRTSATLPALMQVPRSRFCPCVWKRHIFLGPATGTTVLEVFDPAGNMCEMVTAALPTGPSVLVPISDEEILILATTTVRYFPNELRRVTVCSEQTYFYCPGGIVRNKGKVYCALMDMTFWSVRCLEKDFKLKEITKVYD